MAKSTARKVKARCASGVVCAGWELRKHSKNKTPVKDISRALKRTPGALRQKARVWKFRLAISGAQTRNDLEPSAQPLGPSRSVRGRRAYWSSRIVRGIVP
jgi:hypothetical protein